jgi:hypothetical protein
MAYDSKIKQKAYKLFCIGKSLTEISKVKGMPSEKTLSEWRASENWNERREEINKKTAIKLDEKVSDFKVDMIKDIQDIKFKLLSELDNCSNPTKDKLADSLIKLQQQELLLRGEATERKEVTAAIDMSGLTVEELRKLASLE